MPGPHSMKNGSDGSAAARSIPAVRHRSAPPPDDTREPPAAISSRYVSPSGTIRLAVPQPGWRPPSIDASPYRASISLAAVARSATAISAWSSSTPASVPGLGPIARSVSARWPRRRTEPAPTVGPWIPPAPPSSPGPRAASASHSPGSSLPAAGTWLSTPAARRRSRPPTPPSPSRAARPPSPAMWPTRSTAAIWFRPPSAPAASTSSSTTRARSARRRCRRSPVSTPPTSRPSCAPISSHRSRSSRRRSRCSRPAPAAS